jgi:hypothetical protein
MLDVRAGRSLMSIPWTRLLSCMRRNIRFSVKIYVGFITANLICRQTDSLIWTCTLKNYAMKETAGYMPYRSCQSVDALTYPRAGIVLGMADLQLKSGPTDWIV